MDLAGTSAIFPSDLFLDGRGDVRVAYFPERGTNKEVVVSQLRRDGTLAATSIPLPRDTYREVKLANGPEGLWCVVKTQYDSLTIYPLSDLEGSWGWRPPRYDPWSSRREWELLERNTDWSVELFDSQPVFVVADESWGPLVIGMESGEMEDPCPGAQWCANEISGLARMTTVGDYVAIMWQHYYSILGGYSYDYTEISLIPTSSASIEGHPWSLNRFVAASHYDGPLSGPTSHIEEPLNIGSDGRTTVYALFLEESYIFQEDAWEYDEYSLIRPKIRAYTTAPVEVVSETWATPMDSLAEWTLGYGHLKDPEKWGYSSTQAAVTSSDARVGFLVAREGDLDFWMFDGESWYGPYPVASGVDGHLHVVADSDGWYWVTWREEETYYVAAISPESLGLNSVSTEIADLAEAPTSPALAQNYPNPFNAQTLIPVGRPPESFASLDIFNLHGQRVRSLPLPPGSRSVLWEGLDDAGQPVASGIYVYRLQEGWRTWATRRMVLVR